MVTAATLRERECYKAWPRHSTPFRSNLALPAPLPQFPSLWVDLLSSPHTAQCWRYSLASSHVTTNMTPSGVTIIHLKFPPNTKVLPPSMGILLAQLWWPVLSPFLVYLGVFPCSDTEHSAPRLVPCGIRPSANMTRGPPTPHGCTLQTELPSPSL